MKLFSIYDSKAKAYLRPFTLPTSAHAIREVAEHMQQPGVFSDYPEDFSLFEVGEFDEQTGMVTAHLNHESLGTLIRLRNELKHRRAQELAQPPVQDYEGRN